MSSHIPRGEEDIPLRRVITNLPIVVVITDIKSNRKIREERVNFSDIEARRWLGKVTAWCVTNGYSITTCNEVDYVVD